MRPPSAIRDSAPTVEGVSPAVAGPTERQARRATSHDRRARGRPRQVLGRSDELIDGCDTPRPSRRDRPAALFELHPQVRLDEAVEAAVEHGARVADLVSSVRRSLTSW